MISTKNRAERKNYYLAIPYYGEETLPDDLECRKNN